MNRPERSGGGQRKREREREVLDAAIDVFWLKGYAAASVADVAERVGMLAGSLYYYVDSKEDLLMRIIQESHHQAVEILADVASLDAPPLERLRVFVERYVLWYLENIEQVSLYFSEWRNLTGDRREQARDQRKTFEQFLGRIIEAAQAQGQAPDHQSSHTLTFYLLGAMNSLWTWYRRQGPLTPEQIAASYSAMAIATVTGQRD